MDRATFSGYREVIRANGFFAYRRIPAHAVDIFDKLRNQRPDELAERAEIVARFSADVPRHVRNAWVKSMIQNRNGAL